MPNDAPLPVEIVRDLLALARALYAVTSQDQGAGQGERLLKLRGIGSQLTLALEKAESSKPGSFAHKCAWLICEDAIRDLGQVVGELPAAALVEATGQRLLKKR